MLKLQLTSDDSVSVSVSRMIGPVAMASCRIEIHDVSDDEDTRVWGLLEADEAEALGHALLRIARELRESTVTELGPAPAPPLDGPYGSLDGSLPDGTRACPRPNVLPPAPDDPPAETADPNGGNCGGMES